MDKTIQLTEREDKILTDALKRMEGPGYQRTNTIPFYKLIKIMSLHDPQFQKRLKGITDLDEFKEELDEKEHEFMLSLMAEPKETVEKRETISLSHAECSSYNSRCKCFLSFYVCSML